VQWYSRDPTHSSIINRGYPNIYMYAATSMASAGGESSGEECGLQIDVGKEDGRQSKPRGKGAKITKAVEVSWKPGDIVWAKVSGFNYWPAKVATGTMAAPWGECIGGDHPVMIKWRWVVFAR
jgi:hypothetical protein